jgi:hypothetical protein
VVARKRLTVGQIHVPVRGDERAPRGEKMGDGERLP